MISFANISNNSSDTVVEAILKTETVRKKHGSFSTSDAKHSTPVFFRNPINFIERFKITGL
jgi:hypothetical protein